MYNGVLTGLIAGIVTATVLIGVFIVTALLVKRRITTVFNAIVKQPDKDTPAPIAKWINDTAYILASHLVVQAKTTLMGMASVESKNETRQAVAEQLAGNPLLNALVNSIPLAKGLKRNPVLLSLAGNLLNNLGKKNNNHDTGTIVPPKFDL